MTGNDNLQASPAEGYYRHVLSAERLRKCYELAPPRVQQYLEAEIQHVLCRIGTGDCVLELGCGYGRVMARLAGVARMVVGIDNSIPSLQLAWDVLNDGGRSRGGNAGPSHRPGTSPSSPRTRDSQGVGPVVCPPGSDCRRTIDRRDHGRVRNCHLLGMDAAALAFRDASFDVVVCIQNGISAFKVDPGALFRECVRVTRPGGTTLLSSYAERFWPDRLRWFEMQAEAGLLGEIDAERTREGVIVCKDGFTARAVGSEEFRALCASLGVEPVIDEIDGSSLFCEIHVPAVHRGL